MRRMTSFLAGGVLALVLSGAALSGPLEDASAAYEKGDFATALSLLRPMADQGNADAQTGLGWMYEDGEGVPQDYGQAIAWYRMAADQRNAEAQGNLGGIYEDGRGVPQDYVRAHMWFDLAASGASDASVRDHAVRDREHVAAKMTPDQIAEAQRMASEWKPTK
jgi:TPR repeat protein